jgi:AAHS family 4-hydroxybenzoate transporter-like MFS transporter
MSIDEIFRIAAGPVLLGAAVTFVMRWIYSESKRTEAAIT